MGTKHYPVRLFSDGTDDFVMGEKTMKTTPGVAGLVLQRQQCREDFSVVASKLSPFAKNASRRGEHWQGHSEKDCN